MTATELELEGVDLMVKRDGAYTRSERIKEIRRFFLTHGSTSNPGPLPFLKTVAMFQMNMGLTKEKILEYFEVMENLGEIQVNESADQIIVSKSYEE
jgi:hypothetical protein